MKKREDSPNKPHLHLDLTPLHAIFSSNVLKKRESSEELSLPLSISIKRLKTAQRLLSSFGSVHSLIKGSSKTNGEWKEGVRNMEDVFERVWGIVQGWEDDGDDQRSSN